MEEWRALALAPHRRAPALLPPRLLKSRSFTRAHDWLAGSYSAFLGSNSQGGAAGGRRKERQHSATGTELFLLPHKHGVDGRASYGGNGAYFRSNVHREMDCARKQVLPRNRHEAQAFRAYTELCVEGCDSGEALCNHVPVYMPVSEAEFARGRSGRRRIGYH